jgi:hypothetical protein
MATSAYSVQEENLDGVCLGWLDSSTQNSQENIQTQEQFRKIVRQLDVFVTIEEFECYLTTKSDDVQIYLIVNAQLGQEIMPRIVRLKQIAAVYVYCRDKHENECWAKQYVQVIGIYPSIDKTCR